MKASKLFGLLALAVSLFAGSGCKSLQLDPEGVYGKKKDGEILFRADKTITGSYKVIHTFVKWEKTYRAALPVEVSRAADQVREKAELWIDTATALRDAYEASPSEEGRTRLDQSLDLLDAILLEITKHMTEHGQQGSLSPARSVAPMIHEPVRVPATVSPEHTLRSSGRTLPQSHPRPDQLPDSSGVAPLNAPGSVTDPRTQPQAVKIE
jgi:hypothetical protein